MQVKEIKTEGLSRELEVTVPAGDIDKHVESRLKEVGKTIKLPGFRPGKVPLAILKKRYGRAVMGEVLEQAVNESSAKALEDKKLRPAAQPKIEVVGEFDEGKDLTFKMEVETLPEFEVMDLKGLKLEKPVAKVEKKTIDETLERIASQNKTGKPVEEDRPSKKGDILVIDFHGKTKDDGVEHPGMHAHGSRLELGAGQFIPGFEDQLTGKKAGEKVEVEVKFPEDYGATELAGREAVFDVDIQAIEEATEAKIDDDFAKQLGFDDEKALRDAVEHQIKSDYDSHSRLKMKRQLLDVLDEKHKFDVPAGMLNAEYENILQQMEQERKSNPEMAEENISDEEKEELKQIAERRVKLGLILSDIGNNNGVTISDQELQRAVIAEAQKYPGQEKMVFDFFQKNRQALEGLRAPLFEDKVVDLLFDKAEVSEKEVSVEDLTSHDDEEEAKPKAKKKSTAKSKKADSGDDKEEKKTETETETAKKPASKSKSSKSKKSA